MTAAMGFGFALLGLLVWLAFYWAAVIVESHPGHVAQTTARIAQLEAELSTPLADVVAEAERKVEREMAPRPTPAEVCHAAGGHLLVRTFEQVYPECAICGELDGPR